MKMIDRDIIASLNLLSRMKGAPLPLNVLNETMVERERIVSYSITERLVIKS